MKKKSIALLVTAAITAPLLGASPAVASTGPVGAPSRDSWSNEQFVEGVVFGIGPVAEALAGKPGFEYLTELDANADDSSSREAVVDITRSMREADPAGFDSTAELLSSGDPYKVISQMETLNTALGTALVENAAHEVDRERDPHRTGRAVVVAAVAFHVAAAVTAFAVGAVMVVAAAAVVWHAEVAVTRTALRPADADRFVADVTRALSAAG